MAPATLVDLQNFDCISFCKKQNSQDCHRRNMVYMTYCRTCTERQDDEIEKKYSEKGKKKVDEEKGKAIPIHW